MRAPEPLRLGGPDGWLVSMYASAAVGLSLSAADRTRLPLFFACALVMVITAFALYRRNALTLTQLVGLGVLARLIVFWLPPGLSDDAFRYLWDGYVQHAGVNPYAVLPAQMPDWHDMPLYPQLNSPRFFSVYPPLSQVMFWLSTLGEPSDWRQAWYVWKFFCLVAEMGTLLLLRSVGTRGLLLYALHPLPIVEMVGQAHTEALMVFGLVLACRAATSSRIAVAGLGWMVATMTKLYPALLAPFLVTKRQDGLRLLPAFAAVVVLAAIYWTPAYLGNMMSSLRLYTQYYEFNAGLYYAIKGTAQSLTGVDYSKQIGPLLAVAFVVVYLVQLVRHHRRGMSFAQSTYVVIGAFFVLATTVHPWYLAGVLAVLPFTGRPGWHWQVLALISLATYARYTGGPYGLIVALGWGLWLLLVILQRKWDAIRRSSS